MSGREQIPKEAIIVIVICAAGVSVMIAWAIHSVWNGRGGEAGVIAQDFNEQAEYRKDVRLRNQEAMAAANGYQFPLYRGSEV